MYSWRLFSVEVGPFRDSATVVEYHIFVVHTSVLFPMAKTEASSAGARNGLKASSNSAAHDLPWCVCSYLTPKCIWLVMKGGKIQACLSRGHRRQYGDDWAPENHRQGWEHASCNSFRDARYRQDYVDLMSCTAASGRCLQRSCTWAECQWWARWDRFLLVRMIRAQYQLFEFQVSMSSAIG